MKEAGLFLAVLVLSVGTCSLALRIVRRLAILDLPNVRSSHDVPTPRGGGIGILLALLPGGAAGAILLPPEGLGTTGFGALLLACLLLSALGYADDRRGVRPALKMVSQVVAAVVVVAGAGCVEGVALPGLGRVELGWLGPVLTCFWLVGFSNGFNFMDGIDGIAGLHAALAGLLYAGAAALAGGSVWLALPLAAASFGFLAVNWQPAKVFMGDVGSLAIGFLLAELAVLGSGGGVPFVSSFLILGPFLFDTIYTLLRRLALRENLLSAHRSHLYQRLVLSGWSHARVSLLYGGWTLLSGGLGILYVDSTTTLRAVSIGGALLSGMGIVGLVRFRERIRERSG